MKDIAEALCLLQDAGILSERECHDLFLDAFADMIDQDDILEEVN